MRILIVDDIEEYVKSLKRALSEEYQVVIATSLEEAKRIMDNTINLALVDVRLSEEDMSNRDGILFLAWVKEKYPEVPVIMMSAYRDFDSTVDALNIGASYYLKKPININELKNLISFYLKKKT